MEQKWYDYVAKRWEARQTSHTVHLRQTQTKSFQPWGRHEPKVCKTQESFNVYREVREDKWVETYVRLTGRSQMIMGTSNCGLLSNSSLPSANSLTLPELFPYLLKENVEVGRGDLKGLSCPEILWWAREYDGWQEKAKTE